MTTPTAPAEEGTSPFQAGLAALRQGKWDEGRALIEADRAAGAQPDAQVRLLLAVADIRTGRADVDVLADHAISADDLGDLRRLLVNPLVSEGTPARAVRVLDAMIAACPPGLRDLRQRAGLHARRRDWDAAIADADTVSGIDAGDTFDDHIRDTMVAGAGLNRRETVEFVVENAPEAIRRLADLGVPFNAESGALHLTREGGHSHRRIVHVDDATGWAVQQALIARLR
jgi:hypothetical protein